MNQIKVVSNYGQLVTDSRIVSEMIGRNHSELLKDIRRFSSYLSEGDFHLGDFFIESTYTDTNNQNRPCFLITKKGCDMVANKMTGPRGVLFTASYVTAFEDMEKQLTEPKNELQILQRTVNSLVNVEGRVTYLEDHMRIDGVQEKRIQNRGKAVVLNALGGMKSKAYQEIARKVFSSLWRDFKNHFEIPRYNELPKKQFDDAIKFIGMWQPDTSLRIEIESLNNQECMQGVI